MAAVIIYSAKLPPEGAKWCVLCSRLYKGAFMALPDVAARLSEFNKLAPSEIRHLTIRFPPGKEPPLNEAVTTSLLSMPVTMQTPMGPQVQPAMMPGDVCWSHLDGLILKDGVLGYGAADLPQEKGAVLLGGRGG